MDDKLLDTLREYADSKDYIRAIFYFDYQNKNNRFNSFFLIVKNPKIYKLEEDLKEIIPDIVLSNRSKDSFKIESKFQSYTNILVYSYDFNKIKESIIDDKFAGNFLNEVSEDPIFIVDKDNLGDDVSIQKDFFKDPKPYEFQNCIRDFFSNALEASFALMERDRLFASFKLANVRRELLRMTNWYIIDRYSNTKSIGEDGEYLRNTLTKTYKELLERTFSTADTLSIYNSLFDACTTFRKMGLLLEKNLELEYLKREDVEIMKILRSHYKQLESLIN